MQVDELWLYTASVTDGIVTDACKGDSGGPLIIEKGGQHLLIGVLEVIENHKKSENLFIFPGRGLQLPHKHFEWRRKLEQCGFSEGLDSRSHQWKHLRFHFSTFESFFSTFLQDRSAFGEVSGLATLVGV